MARAAILRIPQTLIENIGLATLQDSSANVLLWHCLNIPREFTPESSEWDWDTGDLKVKVVSHLLPEVGDGDLLPTIHFEKDSTGKVISFTLTHRDVVTRSTITIPL